MYLKLKLSRCEFSFIFKVPPASITKVHRQLGSNCTMLHLVVAPNFVALGTDGKLPCTRHTCVQSDKYWLCWATRWGLATYFSNIKVTACVWSEMNELEQKTVYFLFFPSRVRTWGRMGLEPCLTTLSSLSIVLAIWNTLLSLGHSNKFSFWT